MKPIPLITPYRRIADPARKIVSRRHHEDVDVAVGLLEDAVQIARGVESRGVEAFISRGGAAPALFKADLEPPVIEIPVSPFREAGRIVPIKRREKEGRRSYNHASLEEEEGCIK